MAGWRSSPEPQNQAAGSCLQLARPLAPSLTTALAGCAQASGATCWPPLRNCSLINYHFHKHLTAETPTTTLPSTQPQDTQAATPGQGRSWRGAGTPRASSLEQRAMRCPCSAAPRRVWISPLGLGGAAEPSQAEPWLLGSTWSESKGGLLAPQLLSLRRL